MTEPYEVYEIVMVVGWIEEPVCWFHFDQNAESWRNRLAEHYPNRFFTIRAIEHSDAITPCGKYYPRDYYEVRS